MKPTRIGDAGRSRNESHEITSSLWMDIWGEIEAIAYMPLSFLGPSRSNPNVLPSRENEWQLAQVGRPSISRRLRGSATLRSLQATSGIALGGRGLMTPFSSSEGINGTSR